MKRVIFLAGAAAGVLMVLLGAPQAVSQSEVAADAGETAGPTDQDRLYTLGFGIAQNLKVFQFSEQEIQWILNGLRDGLAGEQPAVPVAQIGPTLDGYLRGRMAEMVQAEKAAGEAYRKQAAQESGAVTTESGLIYKEVSPGTGDSPAPGDSVEIRYKAMLTDGTVVDQNEEGKTATFGLDRVIQCLSEGVRKMKVGGKSRLVCPPELAYGDQGFPPDIKPGATLVFDLELVDVKPAPAETGAEKSQETKEKQDTSASGGGS